MLIESEPKIDKLHEEALRMDKNFQKAIPVKEIIPNIKAVSAEEQDQRIHERIKKGDNDLNQDFWQWYLHRKISDDYLDDYGEKIQENISVKFKINAPDILGISENIESHTEQEKEGLDLFKGQIIVDLGAGVNPSGYLLSHLLKAKAYIAVDFSGYNSARLKEKLEILDNEQSNSPDLYNYFKSVPGLYRHKIPFSIITNDMLTFLKRLPDKSVSIFMGGIGPEIIYDGPYRGRVSAEIERVLDEKGGVLTIDSYPHFQNLETVYKFGQVEIFRKKKEEYNK